MDEGKNFQIKKNEQHGIMEDRISFQKTRNCNILTSKLNVDPQRDDDASPMSSYRCMLRPTCVYG